MVRIKNRYLVVNYLYPTIDTASTSKDTLPGPLQFHQPTPDDFHEGKLLRAVQNGVTELFGDYGMGMVSTSLKVNYHSTATSTSIIRCPQAHYEMVWAALTFMTKLPRPIDIPVVIKVVRVSGTIKKAEEKVIRRAKEIILRAKIAEADGVTRDSGVVGDIVKAAEKRRQVEAMVVDEEGSESESD